MIKQILLIGLCLMFLVGCASTITFNKDGTVNAKDYTIKEKLNAKDKTVLERTYAPNRWFNSKSIQELLSDVLPIAGTVTGK